MNEDKRHSQLELRSIGHDCLSLLNPLGAELAIQEAICLGLGGILATLLRIADDISANKEKINHEN